MTAEVISLLSSPPPAIVRPRASSSLAQRRITPPSHALSSDDPFNEAHPQDDISIARSTKQPSFAAFRELPNKRQASTIPVSDDIWSLDDDDFFKSPSPKRQRLSTDSRTLTRFTANSTSPAAAPRPRSPSLEFTSPPRLGTKPTKQNAPAFLNDDDEDDPFASPPPPRREKESVRPGSGIDSEIEEVDLCDDSDDNLFVSNGTPRRDVRKQQVPDVEVPWDPISSSAPLPTASSNSRLEQQSRPMQRSFSEVITLDDDDDDDGPINNNSITRIDSSEDEFPDIDKLDASSLPSANSRWKDSGRLRSTGSTKPKISGKSGLKTTVRRTSKEVAQDKEERAAKAAAREAERVRKKQEAEQAKKDKSLEKQRAAALAEVNKVRTDKKVSTPEMIVDLPDTLTGSLRIQVEALLKDLDIQAEEWTCPVDNVVRWRRKVRSRYNEELGYWEPIPMRIEKEKYAMAILTSSEFIQRVLATDGGDLEAHVMSMQREFPDHTIIYLIESLEPWMRKNRNLRNRQFVSAVLGDQPPASTQERRRRKDTEPTEYVDEDKVEGALLQLQVLHGVLIHHTGAAVETAQWIAIFTQHISTVPYRRQKEESNAAAAGFCMEAGQVRTGDGAKDTYIRMLQEIGRVTAPIAYGIAAEFESVSQLVRGLEDGGPLSLESVRKSANKDGALTDRTVGQAMSKRIYKIFTGNDANSTEV